MQMSEISEANHLRIKISEFTEKLNLDILDETIVRKLIDLIHVNPPSEWDGDVNLNIFHVYQLQMVPSAH